MKEFLSQNGVQFTLRVVDEDDAAYDDLLKLGYRTVPVTVIGTTIVTGFDAAALASGLSRLKKDQISERGARMARRDD